MSIPVICDRCRVAGTAGTGDFSNFGDLLEFEPVKVKQRVNGWDADAQRGFIALLATTGSKRKAAHALGRNAFGIDQLLKRSDAGSFRIAYERAMAVAKQNGAMKIATGVADAAARNAQLTPPSRLIGIVPDGAKEEPAVEEKLRVLESIYDKWMGKVEAERTARLSGDVVAADFYLRQVTFLEVCYDLRAEGLGENAFSLMASFRRDREHIVNIAATPFSQVLDQKRRELWKAMADPDRPPHPPARYLVEKPGFFTQSSTAALKKKDKKKPLNEQGQILRGIQAEEAIKQVEWELSAQSARGADEH